MRKTWTDERFIADQVGNDEVSSDEEMIEYLSENTEIEKSIIQKIIEVERPESLKNPFHEIDFEQYGLVTPVYE